MENNNLILEDSNLKSLSEQESKEIDGGYNIIERIAYWWGRQNGMPPDNQDLTHTYSQYVYY